MNRGKTIFNPEQMKKDHINFKKCFVSFAIHYTILLCCFHGPRGPIQFYVKHSTVFVLFPLPLQFLEKMELIASLFCGWVMQAKTETLVCYKISRLNYAYFKLRRLDSFSLNWNFGIAIKYIGSAWRTKKPKWISIDWD